ncbi:DUF3592 domain-containing protein [Deinococcus carri]|uniref:DUF3592 domain-containing protein n=1 Tax=Deinococcus carri TaxID=1211323 RepID=UPI003CD0AFF6
MQAFTPGCGGRKPPLDLEYRYLWQGQAYAGTRLAAAADFHIWVPDCGVGLVRSLSPAFPGSETRPVTVYVNPRAPREAVLVQGVPSAARPMHTLLWAALLGSLAAWLLRRGSPLTPPRPPRPRRLPAPPGRGG